MALWIVCDITYGSLAINEETTESGGIERNSVKQCMTSYPAFGSSPHSSL